MFFFFVFFGSCLVDVWFGRLGGWLVGVGAAEQDEAGRRAMGKGNWCNESL